MPAPKRKSAARKPAARRAGRSGTPRAKVPMTSEMRRIAAELAGLFTADIMAAGGRVTVRDAKGQEGINASATFENGERMTLRIAGRPAKPARAKTARRKAPAA